MLEDDEGLEFTLQSLELNLLLLIIIMIIDWLASLYDHDDIETGAAGVLPPA